MTTETFSDFCVLWDHAAGKYVVALREDAKNHNAGMAMDKKPGLAVVRDGLPMADAEQIAGAFNGSVRITGDME